MLATTPLAFGELNGQIKPLLPESKNPKNSFFPRTGNLSLI
jgi:hypothetical protein